MENHITCPNCKKIVTDPLVDAAANGEDSRDADFITCECGQRLTYWAIVAQLRGQKTLGAKVMSLFRRPPPKKN